LNCIINKLLSDLSVECSKFSNKNQTISQTLPKSEYSLIQTFNSVPLTKGISYLKTMCSTYPLLELSVATLVKDPEKLCQPDNIKTLPPHIKGRILRSIRKQNLSSDLLAALLHKQVTDLDLEDLDITDQHLQDVAKYKNYRKLNFNQKKKPSFKISEGKENCSPRASDCGLAQVFVGTHYLHTLFLAGWEDISLSTVSILSTNCPRLRYLDLGHCKSVDDNILEEICQNLAYLESLSLTGSAITDVGLATLGRSPAQETLKELRINKCKHITDDGIELMLEGLQTLEILIFNGCPRVTDESRLALDRYLHEHRVNVRQLSWTVY